MPPKAAVNTKKPGVSKPGVSKPKASTAPPKKPIVSKLASSPPGNSKPVESNKHPKLSTGSKDSGKGTKGSKGTTGSKNTTERKGGKTVTLGKGGRTDKKKGKTLDWSKICLKCKKKKTESHNNSNRPKTSEKKKPSFLLKLAQNSLCCKKKGQKPETGKKKGVATSQFMLGDSDFPRQLTANFKLFQMLLLFSARFPFKFKFDKNGNYKTKFVWKGFQLPFLIFTTVLYTVILGSFLYNYYHMVVSTLTNDNISKVNATDLTDAQMRLAEQYELELMARDFPFILPFIVALFHNAVTGIIVFARYDKIVEYFDTMGGGMKMMKLRIGKYIYKRSIILLCCFFGALLIIVLIAVILGIPSLKSGPVALAALSLRYFYPYMLAPKSNVSAHEGFKYSSQIAGLQWVVAIFFGYVYLSSKIIVLYFIFVCDLLRRVIRQWSARTHVLLLKRGGLTVEDCKVLWKEYVVLGELHGVTSGLMSGQIEAYYYPTMMYLAVLFTFIMYATPYEGLEMEAKVRLAEQKETFIRPYDFHFYTALYCFEMIIFLYSGWVASKAGVDIIDNMLDSIREKAFKDSDIQRKKHEASLVLNFLYSYLSYSGWEIGGMLAFNFTLIYVRLDLLFTYTVILVQLEPGFTSLNGTKLFNQRLVLGVFLMVLEDLPPCHWAETNFTLANENKSSICFPANEADTFVI